MIKLYKSNHNGSHNNIYRFYTLYQVLVTSINRGILCHTNSQFVLCCNIENKMYNKKLPQTTRYYLNSIIFCRGNTYEKNIYNWMLANYFIFFLWIYGYLLLEVCMRLSVISVKLIGRGGIPIFVLQKQIKKRKCVTFNEHIWSLV